MSGEKDGVGDAAAKDADHVDGGVHIIFLENGEYLRGIRGLRAVVKGQGDFWKIRIATV